jgi:hypothetical protein
MPSTSDFRGLLNRASEIYHDANKFLSFVENVSTCINSFTTNTDNPAQGLQAISDCKALIPDVPGIGPIISAIIDVAVQAGQQGVASIQAYQATLAAYEQAAIINLTPDGSSTAIVTPDGTLIISTDTDGDGKADCFSDGTSTTICTPDAPSVPTDHLPADPADGSDGGGTDGSGTDGAGGTDGGGDDGGDGGGDTIDFVDTTPGDGGSGGDLGDFGGGSGGGGDYSPSYAGDAGGFGGDFGGGDFGGGGGGGTINHYDEMLF